MIFTNQNISIFLDMSPLKQYLSKIPPKYFRKPAELNNDIVEVPEVALIKNCARKRKRLQNNLKAQQVKDRIYHGPKGPIYEDSSEEVLGRKPKSPKKGPIYKDSSEEVLSSKYDQQLLVISKQLDSEFTKETLKNLDIILENIANEI